MTWEAVDQDLFADTGRQHGLLLVAHKVSCEADNQPFEDAATDSYVIADGRKSSQVKTAGRLAIACPMFSDSLLALVTRDQKHICQPSL